MYGKIFTPDIKLLFSSEHGSPIAAGEKLRHVVASFPSDKENDQQDEFLEDLILELENLQGFPGFIADAILEERLFPLQRRHKLRLQDLRTRSHSQAWILAMKLTSRWGREVVTHYNWSDAETTTTTLLTPLWALAKLAPWPEAATALRAAAIIRHQSALCVHPSNQHPKSKNPMQPIGASQLQPRDVKTAIRLLSLSRAKPVEVGGYLINDMTELEVEVDMWLHADPDDIRLWDGTIVGQRPCLLREDRFRLLCPQISCDPCSSPRKRKGMTVPPRPPPRQVFADDFPHNGPHAKKRRQISQKRGKTPGTASKARKKQAAKAESGLNADHPADTYLTSPRATDQESSPANLITPPTLPAPCGTAPFKENSYTTSTGGLNDCDTPDWRLIPTPGLSPSTTSTCSVVSPTTTEPQDGVFPSPSQNPIQSTALTSTQQYTSAAEDLHQNTSALLPPFEAATTVTESQAWTGRAVGSVLPLEDAGQPSNIDLGSHEDHSPSQSPRSSSPISLLADRLLIHGKDPSWCVACSGQCTHCIVRETDVSAHGDTLFELLRQTSGLIDKYIENEGANLAALQSWTSSFHLASFCGPNTEADGDVLLTTFDLLDDGLEAGDRYKIPLLIRRDRSRPWRYTRENCEDRLRQRMCGPEQVKIHISSATGEVRDSVKPSEFLKTMEAGFSRNALSLDALIPLPRPIHHERWQLLTETIHDVTRRPKGEVGKPCSIHHIDLLGCVGFDIVGGECAFSGAHCDALNGTIVTCLFGIKLWMFVPIVLMTPEDWQHYAAESDSWLPRGKARCVFLFPGDTFIMPPGLAVVHAVFTIETSMMAGSMVWDRLELEATLRNMYWLAQNQGATNEPWADDFHLVLNRLETLVDNFPTRYCAKNGSIEPIKQLMEQLRNCACSCLASGSERCTARCPCLKARRRCTNACEGHQSRARIKCRTDILARDLKSSER